MQDIAQPMAKNLVQLFFTAGGMMKMLDAHSKNNGIGE